MGVNMPECVHNDAIVTLQWVCGAVRKSKGTA